MRTFIAAFVLLGVAHVAFCQQTNYCKPVPIGPSASATASLPTSPAKTDVPQVLVRVRVLELSRTKLQAAGFNLSNDSSHGPRSAIDAILKREDLRQAGTPLPYIQSVFDSKDHLFTVLDTLRKDGVAKVLAEPRVLVLSGQPSSYCVGNRVPRPTRQSDGTVSLESEICGTMMDVLPVVSANQTIRLNCRVKVSEMDSAHCVEFAGQSYPDMRTHGISTTVDIRSGQTLVVSGLVQNRSIKEDAVTPSTASSTEKPAKQHEAKEATEEVEMLFLLTSEIIGPANRPPAPPHVASKPAG